MEQYERHYGVQLLDDLHNYFPALLYDSRRFTNVQDVLQYIISATQNRFNLFDRGQQSYRYTMNQTTQTGSNSTTTTTTPTPTTNPSNSSLNVITETIDITPILTTNLSSLLNPVLNAVRNYGSTINTNESNANRSNQNEMQNNVTNRSLNFTRPQYAQTYTYNIPLNRNHTIPRIPLSMASYYQTAFPTMEGSFVNEMTGIYDDIYSTLRNIIRPDLEPVIVRPTQQQINTATTLSLYTKTNENESEGEGVPDDELCTICQDEYVDGQAVRKINHCLHSFHKSCIDEWFEQNVHCPICRYDIRDDSQSE